MVKNTKMYGGVQNENDYFHILAIIAMRGRFY